MYGVIPTTLTQLTTSAELALSIEEAKLQIRSHNAVDDDLVTGWIAAASQLFQEQAGRSPIIETFEYWLDCFPVDPRIQLPMPPVVSVVSVKYLNASGALVSFDDGGSPAVPGWEAQLPKGLHAPRAWVQLKAGATWPTPLAVPAAVRIQFTAGYGTDEASVPELVKTVLRYTVGDFDRFRTNAYVPMTGSGPLPVPLGVETLLRGFKYTALQTVVPRRAWA